MERKYDTVIIGPITLDHNTDYDGREEYINGGAVTFAGYAAAAAGRRVAVVPKGNPAVIDPEEVFAGSHVETIFSCYSPSCTVMENTYFTADRERRICRNTEGILPYTREDIPVVPTGVYHLAGLVRGDIPEELIPYTALLGPVALDVQSVLRCREADDSLKLYDWPRKKEFLPYITYLKTDAAEAEVMTGLSDREEAARIMAGWGAKEVMITHNTEVLVFDGKTVYREPIKARNLSGRTGRGDTTFSTYIAERNHTDIPEALRFAAAMVSLKMETPGPFTGTRRDVEDYREEFYESACFCTESREET
ncbi:MAG: ribokinase [Lachnospiraceae bacterium]|nr:ribokinase [Lachnospiraceae bacterium]